MSYNSQSSLRLAQQAFVQHLPIVVCELGCKPGLCLQHTLKPARCVVPWKHITISWTWPSDELRVSVAHKAADWHYGTCQPRYQSGGAVVHFFVSINLVGLLWYSRTRRTLPWFSLDMTIAYNGCVHGHKLGRLQSCGASDVILRLRDLDNLSLPPQGTGEVPPTLPAEDSQHLLGELPHQHKSSPGGQDHQRRSHRHQEPAEVDRSRRQDAGLQTAETNLLLSAQRRETQSRRPEKEIRRSSES